MALNYRSISKTPFGTKKIDLILDIIKGNEPMLLPSWWPANAEATEIVPSFASTTESDNGQNPKEQTEVNKLQVAIRNSDKSQIISKIVKANDRVEFSTVS